MSYNVENSPIELLQRRIKYYKGVRGRMRNMHKNEVLVRRYGKVQLKKKVIPAIVENIENKIAVFEQAIQVLEKSKLNCSIWKSDSGNKETQK